MIDGHPECIRVQVTNKNSRVFVIVSICAWTIPHIFSREETPLFRTEIVVRQTKHNSRSKIQTEPRGSFLIQYFHGVAKRSREHPYKGRVVEEVPAW